MCWEAQATDPSSSFPHLIPRYYTIGIDSDLYGYSVTNKQVCIQVSNQVTRRDDDDEDDDDDIAPSGYVDQGACGFI